MSRNDDPRDSIAPGDGPPSSTPGPPSSAPQSLSPASLVSVQKALVTLDRLKAKLEAAERLRSEPIAIIGMACRFPGNADSPEVFFRLLEDGRDAVVEVPEERWALDPRETTKEEGRGALRWGGYLREGVDLFDAGFFGISPREATYLDPQHRLLLEVIWEALERSGQDPGKLAGSQTGVFVGVTGRDYADLCTAAGAEGEDVYAVTGNGHCFSAGRVSYTFGFQGPSFAVDTACSSSLVAVHLACQSLRSNEATMAIAGGVNLLLNQEALRLFAKTEALSPDGRCKTFDASANGFVRGEGAGVVVLKRLSDARRDGDTVLAIIRGSAINQDGRSTGLTAPNVLSQQALLKQALSHARVQPEEVSYIEAHGTGTPLGDPIELEALRAVFGKPRMDGSTCVLGAVKSNVGHLEAAAGVAGLIKVVMSMQRELIPKNLHFRALNPRVSLEWTPFVVPTKNVPWRKGDRRRVAGVSAFALSGTNAHVIVEEPPAIELLERGSTAYHHILPISAKTPRALTTLIERYTEAISAGDFDLRDIAYTAGVKRPHHEHRVAVVGESRQELVDKLRALAAADAVSRTGHDAGAPSDPRPSSQRPKVVFVFPGQGSQWVGMGRELMRTEHVFREALELCEEPIQRLGGFSLLSELAAEEDRSRLHLIEVVQPVLFAMEVALATLWRSWGVTPDCVIGHSMGEVAAARIAGVLSLEDACKVICRRSRLLKRVAGKGAMALVELGVDEADRELVGYEDRLSVAVSNGPRSTVLSGDPGALEEVLEKLEARGVFCRRVKVDVASHSPQMDPLRADLLSTLRNVRPREARHPMRSTVTGALVSGLRLDAAYWVDNLRRPVLFSQVTRELIDDGFNVFIEMSPHPILLPAVEESLSARRRAGATLPSMRRSTSERRVVLDALAALYSRGYPISWKSLYPSGGNSVLLPTYPWQRERYWVFGAAEPKASPARALDNAVHRVVWRERDASPEPLVAPPASAAPIAGGWIVFEDKGGVGAALADAIAARGERVVRASYGDAFAQVGVDRFTIALDRREDYHAVFRAAFGAERPCHGAIHLCALDATPWDRATVASIERDRALGLSSAIHALQAMMSEVAGGGQAPLLRLVTRGAQAVTKGTVTCPSTAALVGLGRTIALEHPEIKCALIDLDPSASVDRCAEQLLGELSVGKEMLVGLRGGGRFVAQLVRDEFGGDGSDQPRISGDATYLVTGGLGGLGLAIARWLVSAGARYVVLAGRRAPSDEAEEEIRALTEAGARVVAMSADISVHADVSRIIEAISAGMPPLRGIVHAAGIVGEPAFLPDMQVDLAGEVLRPKLLGAFHLHRATARQELDFFVLYSSASALLGLSGQAAYAAANAALDAVSHALRDAGVPSMSVQWGPFSGAGLAAKAGADDRMSASGLASITPEEGSIAIARLLARPRPEVAVMALDASRWLAMFPERARDPFFSALIGSTTPKASGEGSDTLHALRAAPPDDRFAILELHIRGLLAKILRMDVAAIDAKTPFHYYGFDSLMGLELRNRLQSSLAITISMADIVTHAEPSNLAELVMDRIDLSAIPAPVAREPAPSARAPLVIAPIEPTITVRPDSTRPPAPAEPAIAAPRSDGWIVIPRPSPAAKMRLFCFPYAGGAAPVFSGWPASLPPEIEVCAIQPPGRHERLHEPSLESVDEMVASLVPALLPYLDRPFAMFGHCLGAIVMFEVLRELAARHDRRPVHVFASGSPPPRRYLAPSVGSLSRGEFTSLLRALGFADESLLADEDAVRHLMPAVKSDFDVAARYRAVLPRGEVPLDVPLTALSGQEDSFAPPSVVKEWIHYTRSWTSEIVLPGGHYFIVPERDAVLRIVGTELLFRLAAIEQASHGERAVRVHTRARTAPVRARVIWFGGLGRSAGADRWPDALGEGIEVWALDLPGRGDRVAELPLARVNEIAEHVITALRSDDDLPFVLFGVDLGALVAFEVARELRRRGGKQPFHLVVGAAIAPQIHYFAPLHHLTSDRMLMALRLQRAIAPGGDALDLPALRAECAAMASYVFVDEPPLDLPITAIAGEGDAFVPLGGVQAWREQTASSFTLRTSDASLGHELDQELVASTLRDAIERPA